MSYDELPPSVNKYLRPSAKIVNGRAMVHMYETKEAKDFKKRFRAYLNREIRKQNWDYNKTIEGHWFLDCVFYQSRVNEDNNNYFKILCDSLKGIVIDDDKNLLVRPQKVLYDSKNPRFKAVLHKAEYVGIFKDENELNDFKNNNCIGCKRYSRNCSILKKAMEGRVQEQITSNGDSRISCLKRKT
ncbi:RusA family crossover junction endodeoxyribonuclease [Bacillus subtilis]|nr:RusA family crossover junction endodeoxyribonuclease [Bacillus subtilis]MED3474682.1 RusA family crossover junction endodeoxyribonuclease [Bacillus subtilis]